MKESTPFALRLSIQRCNEHLLTEKLKEQLVAAVHDHVGEGIALKFSVRDEPVDTPAARTAAESKRTEKNAVSALEQDPSVRDLLDNFGAEIVAGSVRTGPDRAGPN